LYALCSLYYPSSLSTCVALINRLTSPMSKYLKPECILTNGSGAPYQELACVYPRLRPLYTQWELGFDPIPMRDFMRSHSFIPLAAVALYGLFIVGGQAYFKPRIALNWRRAMSAWNLALSIFSAIGLIRTLPTLIHNISTKTFRDNLCDDPESSFGSGATGLWVQLFVLSKFPELFDTLFIVVHKKPLIFLHWYHHITVLLYCWHSYITSAPSGFLFTVMNYAVHAIMYGYYYLTAAKLKPKWFNAVYITYAQIAQMMAGVAITLASFYYYMTEKTSEDGSKCFIGKDNTVAAILMYGSYLLLFVQFFYRRYRSNRAEKKQQ
jgi:elongation of very long chain fatty acids protein 6